MTSRRDPISATATSAARPAPSPGLQVDVRSRLDDFVLDVAVEVDEGEVLVVIGPNGSGKSTLLRTVAGLTTPDNGRIAIGGVIVEDDATDVSVAAYQRRIGMVFQEYQLFDHLSALDNVAFAPRCTGLRRRAARTIARGWLDRLDIADHADLHPWQLSGGQQQRVALARALAQEPAALLLDEPLAALDVESRNMVRRELRTVLSGFDGACVLVTHDPVDVYTLADRVAVLDHGQIVQHGTLAELTAHPRSRFVAELVGTNLVSGDVATGTLRAPSGATLAVVADFVGPAFATIRPSSIALSREVIDSSARNTLNGVVGDVDRLGDRVRVTVAAAFELVAEITPQALVALDLKPGDAVFATVKATDIEVYPA